MCIRDRMYIEPSKRLADLIVPQGGNNIVAINLLTDYIEARLRKAHAEPEKQLTK